MVELCKIAMPIRAKTEKFQSTGDVSNLPEIGNVSIFSEGNVRRII